MNVIKYFFGIILLYCVPVHLVAQEIEYVVPPDNDYSNIRSFSEGLARVTKDSDSVSFIDYSGKPAFDSKFQYAENFHCGRSAAGKTINGKSKYGFINTNGQLVIPYIYDEVQDFFCNRVAVNDKGIWKIINKKGNIVMDDSLLITKTVVYDFSSKSERWEDTEPPHFSDNLLLIKSGEKYGYADTSGKVVIPCVYDYGYDFSDSVALVFTEIKNPELAATHSLSKIQNSLGEGTPDYITSVIDTKGNVLWRSTDSSSIDMLYGYSDGVAIFNKDKKWGVINKKSEVVFEPKFNRKPMDFSEGISFVQVDGTAEGNKDGQLFILDTTGKVISKIPLCDSTGCIYDSNLSFHEGLLAVSINNLWGYMDKTGKLIIKPQFERALNFSEGFAVVVTEEGRLAIIKNPLK